MKETRKKAIRGRKLLSLVLLVATVVLSLTTVTAGNLNKHCATTATECRKESGSLRTASLLSAKWTCNTNGSVESSPAIGDVDGDGAREIVIGSDDGGVYCLNGTSGAIEWFYQTNSFVISSPIIADIDKDGHNEVIVGSNDDNVYCLNSTGQPKWNFTTGGAVISSPVIADLDRDGSLDIVIGSSDNKTYCLNCTGGLKWNYTTGGPVLSTPAIADLNGDGRLEVVIGSSDGNVYCLNRTGKVQWIYTTGGAVDSSPAISDVDGDGKNETVIGSNDRNVYCLNKTGGLEWKYATGGAVRSSPVISDVDKDAHMEVIIGSYDHNVYCLNETGELKWNYTTGGIVSCSATVTDIDSDNLKEVFVGTWAGEVLCLNSAGVPMYNCTISNAYYTGNAILSSPVVADVDGDYGWEVVVGSEDHNIYCLGAYVGVTGTKLVIYVSDSSTGIGVSGASVHSTSEPPGQPSLYNATAIDGSVTFSNILTGPYYFEVSKTGYDNATQYVYVYSNQITATNVSITNRNPSVSSPIYIVIAGMAVLFLMVILIMRSVGGGRSDDTDTPTYSGAGTSEIESRPVVLEQQNERVLSARICPYCGATYVRADASYCWNCGAGLAEESDTSATQGRKRVPSATVGRCMVCGLDVKEDESVVRCPFCSNIAHRTHLLEWLHTRDYCPECYHHLDERDLGSIH